MLDQADVVVSVTALMAAFAIRITFYFLKRLWKGIRAAWVRQQYMHVLSRIGLSILVTGHGAYYSMELWLRVYGVH